MTRRRWLIVVLVAVLALVVGLLVINARDDQKDSSASPHASSSSQPGDVAQFEGDSDTQTDEFDVQEGWEIRWETEGPVFKLAITGAKNLGTVVDQTSAGGGSTFPAGSGTFRIQVTAEGYWTIRIVNHTS